ncbi:MAG: DUF5330 domain-containing protein [Alphaproteobacteria bacterium]
MFLIRTAFWLAVVVLFLPTSQLDETDGPTTPPAAQLSMWQAVGAARTTASDMAGFCDRNLEVCATGEAAWQIFRSKAKYGAQMVSGWFAGDTPLSSGAPVRTLEANRSLGNLPVRPAGGRNTLTAQDRAPAWQGPGAGQDPGAGKV